MDIELGIANVARPVTFSTEEDAASVTEAIESALSAGTPITRQRPAQLAIGNSNPHSIPMLHVAAAAS